PAECAGATAFNSVAETNVTVADATEPNFTTAPGTKFDPVTCTVFPPPVEPAFGLTSVTFGGPYAYLSALDVALVPAAVATVRSTVPDECAGATAFNCDGDTYVTEPEPVEPNFTVEPGTKFVPLTLTMLPPAVGPAVGLRLVTVGEPYANLSA